MNTQSVAAEEMPPWWSVPGRWLARLFPRVARLAELDIDFIERMPRGRFLPWVVLAFTLVFCLFRYEIGTQPWNLGYSAVYTQSLMFLMVAMVFGLLAPAMGVWFMACLAVFDLLATVNTSVTWAFPWNEPTSLVVYPWALAGRLVSYWLLWLLVVEIPVAQRRVEQALLRRYGERCSVTAVSLGTIMTGILVYLWTLGMPVLIRPVFIWAGRSPGVASISPLQNLGWRLAVAGLVLALLTAGLRALWGRLGIGSRKAGILRRHGLTGFLRQLAIYVLLVFALGGIISRTLDAIVLFVAFVASGPIAYLVLRVNSLRGALVRIPYAVRFLLGVGISFALGYGVTSPWYRQENPVQNLVSEFFPLVLTVALSILVFRILLRANRVARMRATQGVTGPSVGAVQSAGLLLVWFAFYFLLPITAWADHCGSLHDCDNTLKGIVTIGAGAAALAGGAAAMGAGAAGAEGEAGAEETEAEAEEEESGWTGLFG